MLRKLPFMVTVSRRVKTLTFKWLVKMKTPKMLQSIHKYTPLYNRSSFKITRMLLDKQFESLRAALAELGIKVNNCKADEHVPEAERAIRTIKERLMVTINQFKIKRYPARVTTQFTR